MATHNYSVTAIISMAPRSIRPGRPSNAPTVQNFLLVWLDGGIDEIKNEDCRNSINQLRQVVNNVNTFTDVDKCIDFVSGIKKEKLFMLVSGALGQTAVHIVHDNPQISAIYIFCANKIRHETWAQEWPKIKGVFTDITPICEALKKAAEDCDHNSVSINLVKATDAVSNQNLDEPDQSFMYTQMLKEILLTIDFEQGHINKFLMYCREQFSGNTIELNNIDKLEKEYRRQQSIWWYTYNYFLHSMLNCALHTMEMDLIIKMGFFLRDLHNNIAILHSKQYAGQKNSNSFLVYRGQGLSQANFEDIVETKGGLIAFNNFLSTSRTRDGSLDFARRTMATSNLVGVLFVITIDPSISSTPFANISDIGEHQIEEEILFSIHSVFRIGQITQIDENNRLWQVDLTLTGDNDSQLHALTEQMREETKGSTGWLRLGKLMIKLGEFNNAEDLYHILLAQTNSGNEKGDICYGLGRIKYCLGNYANAIAFYEKSMRIRQKLLTSQHPDVAECYHDIGLVYESMGEYSKALSYYGKALKIRHNTLPENHPLLATSYTCHGSVYDNMGKYSKALSYYERALDIRQRSLPPNHPHIQSVRKSIDIVRNKL